MGKGVGEQCPPHYLWWWVLAWPHCHSCSLPFVFIVVHVHCHLHPVSFAFIVIYARYHLCSLSFPLIVICIHYHSRSLSFAFIVIHWTGSYHLHHVLLSCTTQNLDQLPRMNEMNFPSFMAPVSFQVPVNKFSFSLANASFFVSFLSLAT